MRSSSAKVAFNTNEAIKIIRQKAIVLNSRDDLAPLIERIGNARIVMRGEASHGTHEYYTTISANWHVTNSMEELHLLVLDLERKCCCGK